MESAQATQERHEHDFTQYLKHQHEAERVEVREKRLKKTEQAYKDMLAEQQRLKELVSNIRATYDAERHDTQWRLPQRQQSSRDLQHRR